MKRNIRELVTLVLLSCGTTGAMGAEKAPQFNGPFHQDRNPRLRQATPGPSPRTVAPGPHYCPPPAPMYAWPSYDPTMQGPVDPTMLAIPAPETAASAELRGQADYLRSMGEYNLNTSTAMINAEQARSVQLDNNQKKAEVFFEKRRLYEEARAAERERQVARAREIQATRPAAPSTSNTVSLFDTTGKLAWPSAVMGVDYLNQRRAIEACVSGAASKASTEAVQLAATMQSNLLDQMRKHLVKPMDYLAAKKFLVSLQDMLGNEAGLAVR